ncbi:MAG: hypothetical protein ACRD9R_05690 [Pyrinomonadaceae bacterium]
MRLRQLIALSLVALALAACGSGNAGPPTVGEVKDFTAVCDKANEGKRVAVDGYLRFPDSFTGDQSVVLRLYRAGDFAGTPIGVQIKIGTQANQTERAPKQYTDNDLKVHLADGQVVGVGTKVRVSGSVYFPIVAQNFPCALENPLVELAK